MNKQCRGHEIGNKYIFVTKVTNFEIFMILQYLKPAIPKYLKRTLGRYLCLSFSD